MGHVEVEPASLAGPGIEKDVVERRVAVAHAFAPSVGTRQLDPMQVQEHRLAAPRPSNRAGAGSSGLRA